MSNEIEPDQIFKYNEKQKRNEIYPSIFIAITVGHD